MFNVLSKIKAFIAAEGDKVISPLYDGITLIGPYAISDRKSVV